ncbi:MAG TPA: TonB-dependent receptor plug domain-containing protein [Methylocystis sp.]|nr:TonB-dependent receptor plug domain-containing protein [Methylocystis sp.]
MSSVKTATLAAVSLLLASSAVAGPNHGPTKVKRAHAASAASQPANNGYSAPYVTGADGRKYPVMELPASATVVTPQMIEDQQATTLGQALRNVSGVYVRH